MYLPRILDLVKRIFLFRSLANICDGVFFWQASMMELFFKNSKQLLVVDSKTFRQQIITYVESE